MTGVYANDLEIACKASDGKSVASFPDPCFSPPAPSAGWIVVPYANTAFAKDATNGSKTVFIGGKPVMLKDKSFFKTSTGNEAAAGPKGVATGTKKGKAYFRSWSMNVKVEGLNVCRHTDLMTHNHNPVNGNTGAWSYLSESTQSKCKDEIDNINNECDVSKKEQKKFIDRQKERNTKRIKAGKRPKMVRPKTWKDEHCMSLLFKPNPDALVKRLSEIEKDAKDLYEDLSGEVLSIAGNLAVEAGVNYGERVLIKHGTATAVGAVGAVTGPGVVVTEGAAHLVAAVIDVIDAVISLVSFASDLYGAWDQISGMKNMILEIPEKIKEINSMRGNEGKKKELRKKLVEEAREAAENDDCLAARKCMLVPYRSQHQLNEQGNNVQTVQGVEEIRPGRLDTDMMGTIGMGHSSGCCPGQTGHHLIPGAWVRGVCTSYNHGKAPVICAEGQSQNDGSHKTLHDHLNNALADKGGNKKYPKDQVIEMAIDSHRKTYADSGDCTVCIGEHPCSKECLRAQLEEAYKGCTAEFDAKHIHLEPDDEALDSND